MNRIDSFADAMTGWLAEYAQKQQVSKFGRCGESAGSEQKKAASGSSELVRNTPPLLITEQRPIHLVPEPPAIRDLEISQGAHPADCNCLDCRIRGMYEEEA